MSLDSFPGPRKAPGTHGKDAADVSADGNDFLAQQGVLTFAAGTGLGYFLERWGTTRECWIYYTHQTPPLFAVLAHGMAAVAFWRTGLLFQRAQAGLIRTYRSWDRRAA